MTKCVYFGHCWQCPSTKIKGSWHAKHLINVLVSGELIITPLSEVKWHLEQCFDISEQLKHLEER